MAFFSSIPRNWQPRPRHLWGKTSQKMTFGFVKVLIRHFPSVFSLLPLSLWFFATNARLSSSSLPFLPFFSCPRGCIRQVNTSAGRSLWARWPLSVIVLLLTPRPGRKGRSLAPRTCHWLKFWVSRIGAACQKGSGQRFPWTPSEIKRAGCSGSASYGWNSHWCIRRTRYHTGNTGRVSFCCFPMKKKNINEKDWDKNVFTTIEKLARQSAEIMWHLRHSTVSWLLTFTLKINHPMLHYHSSMTF